ncbi:MAG: preprotein translocase subunit SecE [Verrucomicrobiia bacterium]
MFSTTQIVLLVVGAVALLLAWRKGHLLRLAHYVGETNVELKKCNWPSKDELKGSTVLVMFSVVAVGFITFFVDILISQVIKILM